MQRVIVAGMLAIVAVSCAERHGPPRPVPAPPVDTTGPLRVAGPLAKRIAAYQIDATFDPAQHAVTATQTLTWTNPGSTAVAELPFHLYLNAFRNDQSLFWQTASGPLRDEHRDTGPASWGYLQLDSVQVGGSELVASLRYEAVPSAPTDRTVAWVTLPTPVEPGASVQLAFRYVAKLPVVFARTGYQGDFHLFAQWFPKIGVRVSTGGGDRWVCPPFHGNSEFFADFGTYQVRITAPTSYVVTGTGVLSSVHDTPEGQRTSTFVAEDVHDFAWVADPFLELTRTLADVGSYKVDVRVWARSEQRVFARRHLHAAVGTLETLSKWLRPYPYAALTIIDPPLDAKNASGMEYPTFVTTGLDHAVFRKDLRVPEFVTVHEVAHQWFGGMLASNETEEAWLDEGFNDWIDGHVMRSLYGTSTNLVDTNGWQADFSALRRAVATAPHHAVAPIATVAAAFPNMDSYSEASYGNTAFTLATMESLIGHDTMLAEIKQWAQRWAFDHPTGRDFFAQLRPKYPALAGFLPRAFTEISGIDLRVADIACGPLTAPQGLLDDKVTAQAKPAAPTGAIRCHIRVENRSNLAVPVELDVEFADGSSERLLWPADGSRWHVFTVDRTSDIAKVAIDPDRKLVLDDPFDNQARLIRDDSAAYRAGARLAFWTQTVMQWVGL